MAKQLFANNVSVNIQEFLSASDTTITVDSTSRFPSISGGDWIMATIVPNGGQGSPEVVKITAISGNNLTVVRGQEGTTAQSFHFGAALELRITKGSLEYLRDRNSNVNANVDFGATGNGTTDDTAALRAAFDFAIPLKRPVELSGNYLVTGEIQPFASRASGELHIVCNGEVTITLDPSSSPIRELLYLETTVANNSSITGGSLTVNCNDRAASALTVRHNAASAAGTISWTTPVTVLNCKANDSAAIYENQGILIFGDYSEIILNKPKVIGVQRTNTSGGACKGISISGFSGEVSLHEPHVENVLCPTGSTDADGIACFGKSNGTNKKRDGMVSLFSPVFVDCSGRSYKSQCSSDILYSPTVKRQFQVSMTNGADFEFQAGNGIILEPTLEYKLNGATSPLGSSFSCFVFQHLLEDSPSRSIVHGGTIRSEVLIPRLSLLVHQATANSSDTEISGIRLFPLGSLSSTVVDRALLEFDASTVEAKATKTKITLRDISGPINCYAIGFTSYGGSSLSSKLSFIVKDLYNSLPISSVNRVFNHISGTAIVAVEAFSLSNNFGYRDLLPSGWTFNFQKLVPGTSFSVDLSTVVATNPPGWGASGFAHIECLGQYFADTDKSVRVTKDNAAVANTVFFTQDGGTTWGTIR